MTTPQTAGAQAVAALRAGGLTWRAIGETIGRSEKYARLIGAGQREKGASATVTALQAAASGRPVEVAPRRTTAAGDVVQTRRRGGGLERLPQPTVKVQRIGRTGRQQWLYTDGETGLYPGAPDADRRLAARRPDTDVTVVAHGVETGWVHAFDGTAAEVPDVVEEGQTGMAGILQGALDRYTHSPGARWWHFFDSFTVTVG